MGDCSDVSYFCQSVYVVLPILYLSVWRLQRCSLLLLVDPSQISAQGWTCINLWHAINLAANKTEHRSQNKIQLRALREHRKRGMGVLGPDCFQAETCFIPPPQPLSLLPTFSPKAPLISWNLINREPFCELVYWAVASSEEAELEALCRPPLSASLAPMHPLSLSLLSGNKLGGGMSLSGWGGGVAAGPSVALACLLPDVPPTQKPHHSVSFSPCSSCKPGPNLAPLAPLQPQPCHPPAGAVW